LLRAALTPLPGTGYTARVALRSRSVLDCMDREPRLPHDIAIDLDIGAAFSRYRVQHA